MNETRAWWVEVPLGWVVLVAFLLCALIGQALEDHDRSKNGYVHCSDGHVSYCDGPACATAASVCAQGTP